MSHSLETRYEIWDDNHGGKLVVGPDHDGLDLIEIQTFPPVGPEGMERRLVLTEDAAELLMAALGRALADLRIKKENA